MKIIRPVTIGDSNLVSSNIAETDYGAWNSGTTYALGDKVISTTTHRIYESAQGSNLNHNPTTDDGTWWTNIGATNRWRAFDKVLADQSERTGTITYNILPNNLVNAVALFNVDAATVNIVVDDPIDGEVYNETISMVDNTAVTDWYNYFFEPVARRSEVAKFDLPNYSTANIIITLDSGASVSKVGEIVLGAQKTLGLTNYGTSVGIQDYSRKERDVFGNAIILERRFSQTVDFDVQVETESVRDVQKTLATFRATPIVFTGSDAATYGDLIYGYYRNFSINISSPSLSDATIEVEGLV